MKIPVLLFLSILLSGLRAVYADTPLTAKVDKRVESLVRVSVIRYLLNHGDTTAATRQVKQDIAQGFPWMSKLSRLLTTYEKQRNAYPTMESFMPRIVEFFNNTADQIDRWPRFVSIEEFENGDNQVDPDLKTLTIRFDRPMSGGYGFGYGPLGQEHFPLKKVNGYPNDRTITIDTALKPNFEYQINLLSIGFFFYRRMADQKHADPFQNQIGKIKKRGALPAFA